MADQKNKYEQVIKALDCCRDFGDCSLCPYERATYGDELDCTENLHTDALSIIIRQNAEIADLQDALKCEKETNDHLCGEYMSAKSEVAREIFEDIEKYSERTFVFGDYHTPLLSIGCGVFAALKKKYTEDHNA